MQVVSITDVIARSAATRQSVSHGSFFMQGETDCRASVRTACNDMRFLCVLRI